MNEVMVKFNVNGNVDSAENRLGLPQRMSGGRDRPLYSVSTPMTLLVWLRLFDL